MFWDRTVAANPRIEDIEKLSIIAVAYLSQSCDPRKVVFVGRLVASNHLITDHYQFKAVAALFYRDVEAATGCVMTDLCCCDKLRWMCGLKSPEHLLFARQLSCWHVLRRSSFQRTFPSTRQERT